MRKLSTLIGVLLFTLLVVACTETPVEPVQETDAATPAFNFTNGPTTPGNSPIERWKGEVGIYSVTAPDQGLRLRLYDALDTWRCGGAAADPEWLTQDVWADPFDPTSPPWEQPFPWDLNSMSQSMEVPLVLYPFPNDPAKDFCDFLAEDYIAYGTGTAIFNDNNMFWWTGTGGTDSYGTRVRGTLQDDDGNMYNVVGNNHTTVRGVCCEFGGVDPAEVDFEQMSSINTIKFHPIKNGLD